MSETIVYHNLPGYYEALCDGDFYCDPELKMPSCWKINKGQRFYLEEIVKIGDRTQAKVRLNNDIRYCSLRDDLWKLIYITSNKIINESKPPV